MADTLDDTCTIDVRKPVVNACIGCCAAIVMSKITGTKAQFDTALSDDDFVYEATTQSITGLKTFLADIAFTAADILLQGNILNLSAITFQEVSDFADLTIADDNSSAGFRVKNTDGSIELHNGTSTANSFNAIIHLHSAGSNTRRGAIISSIPVAEDTCTSPVLVLNSRQEDSTPIVNRDLLHIENDGAVKFAIDKDGNVDLQANKLTLGGDLVIDLDNSKLLFGTGNDASILYDGTDLIIDPDVVGGGDLKVDAQQIIVTKTGSTQRFVMDRDEILGDGTNIGVFRARAQNAATTPKNYAQIFFTMEEDSAGAEDGSINLNILKNGASTNAIMINDGNNGLIDFAMDLDISTKNILTDTTTVTKIGTATNQKIGFYNTTPVIQPTALTVADAVTIDATFDSTEQTTMINMRTRINEIETKLQALGLLA